MYGKEGKSEWAEAVGATALVCLLASLALIAAGGWTWFAKLLDTSAPAWVQAIGSVGAIFITGWSVRRAHRLQLEQRDRDSELDYTRTLDIAFHLVARVRVVATKIQGYEANGPSANANRRAMHAELSALLDGYRHFDAHRLQRYEYVRAVWAGDACARHLLSIIDAQFAPTALGRDNELGSQAAMVVNSLKSHIERLDEAMKARGGTTPVGS